MKLKKNHVDYGFPEAACLTSGRELCPGQLVRSLAGRDRGEVYLVIAEEGANVWVADGRKRGVSNPKKKNRRHLQWSYKVAADCMAKLTAGKITDEAIRDQIRILLSGDNRKEGN